MLCPESNVIMSLNMSENCKQKWNSCGFRRRLIKYGESTRRVFHPFFVYFVVTLIHVLVGGRCQVLASSLSSSSLDFNQRVPFEYNDNSLKTLSTPRDRLKEGYPQPPQPPHPPQFNINYSSPPGLEFELHKERVSRDTKKNAPNGGPSFGEEPSDSFIVRTKSAILKCKALNALNAWFECSSGDEKSVRSKQTGHNYVDPQTGIRIIELQLEITRKDIEEFAASISSSSSEGASGASPAGPASSPIPSPGPISIPTPFQCWCHAYGGHQTIQSRKAAVQFSYLRRHFINEPLAHSVELGAQTSFTCLPPEGHPKAKLLWLKNGHIINTEESKETTGLLGSMEGFRPEEGAPGRGMDMNGYLSDSLLDLIPDNLAEPDHSNYLISHDGSLIIKQATLSDHANYTCAVRNPAGTRYSEPAELTVYVNGGWSSWSDWTACNVKCGRGIQKRVRSCSYPTPLNGGQGCGGESMQVSDCSVICSPVNGQWTSWSSWSTCSHECQQVRRRSCNAPSPKYGGQHCSGADFHIRNCTGGMCRKLDLYQLQRREKGETSAKGTNDREIYLLAIISTAFLFLFVVFVAVVLRRRRHKNSEGSLDEERCQEDGHAMLEKQQRPDLIRTGRSEKMQLITRISNCNANILDHFVVRNDHLMSNTNSIDSGICASNNNSHLNNPSTHMMVSTPKLAATPLSGHSVTTSTASANDIDDDEDDDGDDEDDNDNVNDNGSEPDYAEPVFANPLLTPRPSERRPPLPSSCPPCNSPGTCPRNPQLVNFFTSWPEPPSTPAPPGPPGHRFNKHRNTKKTKSTDAHLLYPL